MPSDQKMAEWHAAPLSAPKKVRVKSAAPAAAPHTRPTPMGQHAETDHAEMLQLKKPTGHEDFYNPKEHVLDEGPPSSYVGGKSASNAWMFIQATDEEKAAKEKAAAEANTQAQRDARADALGIAGGALVSAAPELKKLTDEQYFKLSDRQRAAVDFNTMLTTAVRKDKHRQGRYEKNATDVERKTYDQSVENLFGKDGGSDLYAPETVAVLRQLKIDDKAADLDQYLGLQVAITAKDLKAITDAPPKISVNVPTDTSARSDLQGQLIDQTNDMEDRIAKGKTMLQTFQATAADERRIDLRHLGGASPKAGRPALGYKPMQFEADTSPSDLNTYFQVATNDLAQMAPDVAREKLGEIRGDLNRPGEWEAFVSFLDRKTENSKAYGSKIGDLKGVDYPSADEYRKILGLEN